MSDDFPETVKKNLASRVGYLCSNPGCRAFTSGPQEDPAKAVNVGVAAHITAASVGGPRYEPEFSPAERSSTPNGIWLCQNCAKLVDNDAVRFSVEVLKEWKHDAEEEAKRRVGKSIVLSASKGDVFMDVAVLNEETTSWNRGQDMVARYSIDREKDHIRIQPNLGYLTLFRNGGPIVPLEYVMSPTHCPFKWDFPSLDFKVLNNQSTPLFLNEVILDVSESRPDLAPLFTIRKDTQRRHAGDLRLVNEGWSDLTDLSISFRLSPGTNQNSTDPAPPFPHTISVPLLGDYAQVDVTGAFRAAGADIDGMILLSNAKWDGGTLVATRADGTTERMTETEMGERWARCLGPFRDEVGTLSGEISYTTPDDTDRRSIKFGAPVYLSNEKRVGILKPPSYEYDTAFEVNSGNYQRRVQISHTLKPGEADRFTVKVSVERSSFHRFHASLRDISGLTLRSIPIEMNCFVPRSRRTAIEKALDPAKDPVKLAMKDASDEKGYVVQQEPPRTDPPQTCNGHHLCPICQSIKPCAFGLCGLVGETKCDSCLYVEEYGLKTAEIIEAAISVAAKLHDATGRLANFITGISAEPWNAKEEARAWMNEANTALETLDSTINRIHLRLKSRNPTA